MLRRLFYTTKLKKVELDQRARAIITWGGYQKFFRYIFFYSMEREFRFLFDQKMEAYLFQESRLLIKIAPILSNVPI